MRANARALSLQTERRLIQEHISGEPVELQLIREPLETTNAGGVRKGPPVTLPPQTFRIVPFKRRLTHQMVTGQAAEVENLAFILVGRHDADVQKGDRFEYDNGRYFIQSINPDRTVRTAADVTYLA